MMIFPLVSAFLTFVFVLACMGGRSVSSSVVFGPFVRGFVSLFPAYLLIAWFEWGVTKQFLPAGLYFWHATGAFVLPIVALAIMGALCIRPVFSEQPTEVFVGIMAFASGFITAWALADTIFGSQYPGRYTVFLEPVLRVSIMLMLPALLTAARATFGMIRVLCIGAAVLWLFLLPFAPMLYFLGFFTWSLIVTLAVLVTTVGVVYVLQGYHFSSYR